MHVLLTKADKLNQRDRAAALKDAQKMDLRRRDDRAGVLGHGQDRSSGRPEAPRPDVPSSHFLVITYAAASAAFPTWAEP